MIEGSLFNMSRDGNTVRLIIDVTVPEVPPEPIKPGMYEMGQEEYPSKHESWELSKMFIESQQREIALLKLGAVSIQQLEQDEVVE